MISVNAHLHRKDRTPCPRGTPRSPGPPGAAAVGRDRVPRGRDQVCEAAWKETGSSLFPTGKMGLLLNEGCACTGGSLGV